MRMRIRSRLAMAAAVVVAAAVPLLGPGSGHAASGESLTVDLSTTRGPSLGVGEGFLYGISSDGTQPSDQYLQPLGITAFRGGGWFSGGWIRDNYTYGSATQADVNSIIAEARRLTQPPYHAQYQVLVSDIYGANGGQPSNTMYPCDNGNCSNWVSFIDSTVGALQATGLKFAYDIWNEPDISVFWTRGVASAQYFQMWDTAYREIRRIAPNALIVGPSAAYTPDQNPGEWNAFFSHTKAAGTVPDEITNHDEGDGDDPVQVGQNIDQYLANNGLSPIPLSANEYQPADRQSAGVTAWYDARFAQSNYVNAMRGNWSCCITPNLTGVLTQVNGSWQPTGSWWVLRDYADMTGSLVSTNNQVGSTAIAASEDSSAKRAVAVIGDENGYTGAASVTFSGFGAVPWLAGGGSVNVVVDRIPDQAPLSAPQVVFNQQVSTSGGSATVSFTFQSSHDAFAVYLTPTGSSGGNTVTVANPGGQSGAVGAAISGLQISASDSAAGQTLTYSASGLPPGLSISSSGLITGTPSAGGTYTVSVTATDTTGAFGSTAFSWSISGGGGSSGPLHAVGAGRCLEDPGSNTSGGTQVDIWDCNGGANQAWTHTSSNQLQLSVGGQSFCLDANGRGTSAGTKAIIWSCNGQSNQQWNLNSNGTITGVQSGLCLDVSGAGTANGSLVELWTCNGGSNQQWKLGS